MVENHMFLIQFGAPGPPPGPGGRALIQVPLQVGAGPPSFCRFSMFFCRFPSDPGGLPYPHASILGSAF
jgi:hypothetical protein